MSVQHVELAERHAAGAHLLHRGLVLAAPGIGEGEPVELVATRRQHGLGLARDAAAPIDHRAEDIEEQRLRGHGVPAASVPIPKFASLCCTFVCQLRNRRTLATYCPSVAWVQKSAFRTRRGNDADF